MSRLPLRYLALASLVATVLTASPLLLAQGPTQPAVRDKIIRYVRGRFNIGESVKLTMTDLRETAYPDFLETTVTLDDGKDKRTQPLFVSKDLRYMIEGSIFNLGGDPREDIIRLISLDDQPAAGPANAPVTLVEYSDLQCPICAKMQEELETDIIPKYGDKLRVVFKEFPLVGIHDWALTEQSRHNAFISSIPPSTFPSGPRFIRIKRASPPNTPAICCFTWARKLGLITLSLLPVSTPEIPSPASKRICTKGRLSESGPRPPVLLMEGLSWAPRFPPISIS